MSAESLRADDVPELPPRLEEARRRFHEWRRTRPAIGPIPAELWAEAAICAAEYGVNRTARLLGLDSAKLKRQSGLGKKPGKQRSPRRATFVEVAPATGAAAPECVLEVESRAGTRLRIHLRGSSLCEVAELARRLVPEGS
jgi:hypothetical protein